jgi:hypothetical protein
MRFHMAFRRFAFAFATAFAVLYALVRAKGLALFTFYPTLGVVLVGLHRSHDVADPALEFLAPEMYWYGWTATAATGGAVVWIYCRAATRPMDALVLAWIFVGDPGLSDDPRALT